MDRAPSILHAACAKAPGHAQTTSPDTLPASCPSPPARGEREGPIAQRWEGEVGAGERSGIPHLTPTLSAPKGGEGGIPTTRLVAGSVLIIACADNLVRR